MTSKTFKSDNELAKTISITRSQGRVLVEIEDPKHLIAINLSDNNAPALSLAILEAAGYSGADHNSFGMAVHQLNIGLIEQERITAETKEQAELEAEALKLLLAFQAIDDPDNRGCEWHQYGTNTKDKWLAVARKAREMRKS